MKMLVADELGCVYRLNSELDILEWCPMSQNGLFDFDLEGGAVEPELVGDETVTFQGKEMSLDDVYEIVYGILKGESND